MLYAVTALVLGLSVFSSSSLQLPGFAGKEKVIPLWGHQTTITTRGFRIMILQWFIIDVKVRLPMRLNF